ncbi:hypothetical protein BS78_05G195000 [Paspalum vaginatum]|nr:hypothetical protein BS78_05G195000 [Paspalum vaginatum]
MATSRWCWRPTASTSRCSIGAVVSPANPVLTAGEISRLVEISKPTIAFAVPTTASKLPSGLPAVLLDSPTFQAWLQLQGGGEHHGDEPAAVVVEQSDTAAIEYSSGTTAAVKAVALSHGNFIAALALIYEHSRRRPLDLDHERRRVLQARPIATSMGFVHMLFTPALGDTLVIMSCAVEEEVRDILGMAERHRVTDMTVPPPLVVAMARGEAAGIDVSSLRRLVCGGAALPVSAEAEFRRRFPGVLLGVGYGMTEAAGGISTRFDQAKSSRLGSVGHLSPAVQAKIVHQVTGEHLSTNQIGELHLSGPLVMKGYIGDDKANSGAFDSDGWLKTGDLCYIDQDGFLFIADRIKDLMNHNGHMVQPAELEQILHSVPGIADAIVIPFPHEELGDLPTALVVAPYKRIWNVIFVDSIPRPPSGKIMRRELLRMVKEGHGVNAMGDVDLGK